MNPAALEPRGNGPTGCRRTGRPGRGHVEGDVAFGAEVVPERATIESFYAPGGGSSSSFGDPPVLMEIVSRAIS